jgi:hypothetical protein
MRDGCGPSVIMRLHVYAVVRACHTMYPPCQWSALRARYAASARSGGATSRALTVGPAPCRAGVAVLGSLDRQPRGPATGSGPPPL